MKTQRVYIDTSVIGGCFDPEFSNWSNGLVKDLEIGNFKPVISEIVATEINSAPQFVRNQYDKILLLNPEILKIDDEALELVSFCHKHDILGAKYRNDMLHIALATIAEVDILVSWNFKHIVRFDKIRLFNAVNIENGFKRLEIYSPREVTIYGNS